MGVGMRNWVNREVDDRIARMVEGVRKFRFPHVGGKPPVFITISRAYGCEAFELAGSLAERLNSGQQGGFWDVYDKTLVELVAQDSKISERLITAMTVEHRNAFEEFLHNIVLKNPSRDQIFIRTARVMKSLAWHGSAVIIGRGGFLLCGDMPGGFHVQVVAPERWRVARLMKQREFDSDAEALSYIRSMDRAREQFFRHHFGRGPGSAADFDLVFNNSRFTPTQMAGAVIAAMRERRLA